jgi:hypothetical protein
VRVYGGKSDEDLDGANQHTESTQKWVNLYSIMLDQFKGAGRKVTMDSAYMGDIMALIGRHEWLTNMVGTTNENRTGADATEERKAMKKCTYESIFFQHKKHPLVYAMWLVSIVIYIYVIFYYTNMVYALHVILHIHARSDNNIVKQKMELRKLWDTGSGRTLRKDAKEHVAVFGRTRLGLAIRQYLLLKRRQQEDTWRLHQSITCNERGRCVYAGCPNRRNAGKDGRKRSYSTHHKCEECSAKKSKHVYLCNDLKNGGLVVNCHMKYHMAHFSKRKA